MKKYLTIIIFFSLVALWPFFKAGFFESHDGEWMVIRFSAFHQTLAAGQFPVRFVDRLNNNFGYPVMNFLYPLPFYLAEIPKILGFSFANSVKIVFVFASVFSVVAMFWALSVIFSKEASLVGSLVYLFIPYRFVDLYVRGSLGENLAFAIAPFILLSIFKIKNSKYIFLPIISISTAALILSHNVIALLFLPIFLLISTILVKNGKRKLHLAFLLGIFISAFFWFPAIYDLQFVKFSQITISDISEHLSPVNKLIVPSWGYGPNPNTYGGLSTQLGLVSIALFISSLHLFLKSKSRNKVIAITLIVYLISFLLMTKSSSIIWQISYFEAIQFPWRLLSVIVLSTSLLAAFTVDSLKEKKLVSALIITASIVSTITYIKPANFMNREDGFYSTNEDTTTVKDEYMPIWVSQKPQTRPQDKITLQGSAVFLDKDIKPTIYKATINSEEESSVVVNSVYFPGHRVTVDGKVAKINHDNPYGLITFQLPSGIHKVIIKYSETPIHLISEIVSIFSAIGACAYLIFLWRKQNS